VLVGGAILDEAGDMIGSMLLLEFPDRRIWMPGSPQTPT
jgi:hypothetical protein